MVHFRGEVTGRGLAASCLGTRASGLRTEAQSWQGKVEVRLSHDAETGIDYALVSLMPHEGSGVCKTLYFGPVGEYKPVGVAQSGA